MAYLGVTPTQEFSSVAKQSLTGDGSVSYTLNKGVSDANDLAVFVNDVRQEPGAAYTASGNTITFTANLESTDDCYILHIGRTFTTSSAESPGIKDNATQKVLTITTDGHLVPTANVTYDLGTSDLRFRDIYLSGSSIELGSHSITSNATHVSIGGLAFSNTISGDGSDLTSLNASELASGTIPDARFPATLPAANGTNLTSLNATEITTGTIDNARLPSDINVANDLTIGGDFIVNGNTTTIAANELKVEDSLIQLASNNEISDIVDIGFIGHYYDGSTQVHTGFFRDASDEQYYLFKGYEDADFDTDTPPSTIDRAANTFALADLNVGAFTSTGNVGIGTGSTIDGLLHLKSTGPIEVILEADTDNVTEADNPRIIFKQDGGAVVGRIGYVSGTNDFEIVNQYQESVFIGANNVHHVKIEPSGDVGIGTTPESVGTGYTTLDIVGSGSTVGGAVRMQTSGSETDCAIFTNSNGLGLASYSDHSINFYTNSEFSTPKMTIAANGNIGIANSDPTELLYVEGDIEVGAKRSLYEAYLSNTFNWVKIYEKHYQSSAAFNYGGQHVLVTQSGATGGQSSYAQIHINNKQQSTGDYSTIVYTEGGGERVMDVAYYYDSAGGDYSGGLLTVWVKAVLNYMTVAVHGLSNSKPDKDNAGQLMAVDTGSATQPASSTLLSPNITNLETKKIGIGESSPSSKLHVKDGGYGIRIGSDTVHSDTTNIPETEMIMFNRTTDGADIASIGVMDGAAGRLAFFSREGMKFYTGGGVDWASTSLAFTIDNVGNIVYPPSGSDTGLYFGGETSGSSYGYIRNPAGTDGQIEIGSDAYITFTETDGDIAKVTFDINSGLFTFVGNILPATNNAHDLGSSSLRWANIYVNDFHLSNENKEGGNDIDGTTGDWTIQEGEENLYIVNNKSGKKYKFKLEEV